MPDMQTALKEALNEWDDSLGRHQVEKQQPTPLPEVTQMQPEYTPAAQQQHGDALRAIFDYIKANPNSATSDLLDAGLSATSVPSAIHRLYLSGRIVRKAYLEQRNSGQGPVMRNVYRYTAAVENVYDKAPTIPNPQTPKKKIILRKKQAAQPAQGIAALPVEKTKEESERIGRPVRYEAIPENSKPPRIALTAAYVIDNISLSEAVLLHAELKKMLG